MNKIIYNILLILGTILLLLGVTLSNIGDNKNSFNQIEIDINAKQVDQGIDNDDMDDNLIDTIDNGTITINVIARPKAKIHLDTSLAEIYYVNPNSNNVNTLIELEVDGEVIAKSGILQPGYMLEELENVNTTNLGVGEYNGSLVVWTYNIKTGERSIVSYSVDLDILVE